MTIEHHEWALLCLRLGNKSSNMRSRQSRELKSSNVGNP
ncbi:hypothetical protein LINPERHAP2_LOCUS29088 [Linum perenne]